jgi:hypothetical protein
VALYFADFTALYDILWLKSGSNYKLPAGNQTWQWTITHLWMISPKSSFQRDFLTATFDCRRVSINIFGVLNSGCSTASPGALCQVLRYDNPDSKIRDLDGIVIRYFG